MRVFLDANVLFSAAYSPEASVRAIFRLAEAGACELVASAFAADEARRNIARKHPARIAALEALIAGVSIVPEGPDGIVQWARSIGLPAKDAPILAAAVHAGADILATGDRSHFGHFYGKKLRGTAVLSPRAAIERVLNATD